MKVREGENPETYRILRDRLGLKHGEEIFAHMMANEMNLNNGMCSNLITGEIVGISSEDSNLKSIREDALSLIKNVLQKMKTSQFDKTAIPCRNEEKSAMTSGTECSRMLPELWNENDIDNEEEDLFVSHVNQFRLHTCKNKIVSLEFFFND